MKRIAATLMALVVVSACSKGDNGGGNAAADSMSTATSAAVATPESASTSTAMTTTAPAGPAPTDPQIADIVLAANDVDIKAGQQAKDKATNPKVKQFAQRMITDHTAVNKQATDLANKLKVKPEENPTSSQLRQGGDQSRQALAGQSGAAYDKGYIDHEVAYHQQVLDALDNTLIPNAQNAELKALLQKTRPAVAAHLDMAKQIQSSLGGGTQ